ncbi:BCS1 N terminal-domain-containing protein [Biscogniauxia mediterranea]|nr:BCS1 N terminal-domain-containing protein [Biscogniauxia mediterranea]
MMNCSTSSPEPIASSGTLSDPNSPPQLALLDFFFPGFSTIAGAIEKYLHIDLNVYIPVVLLAGALILAWSYTSHYFWEQIEQHFMSVVDIRTDDEIYQILLAWVAAQQFSKGARRFIVNASRIRGYWYWWSPEDDEDEEYDENGRLKKKRLTYTPSFGTHHFWYRGRLLQFRRSYSRDQRSLMIASECEEISLSCFGRDPSVLKQLLQDARERYLAKDEKKTLIYRGISKTGIASDTSWQRCMARAHRPFSTVILNESKKKEIIDDISDYLCPTTQRWYANRGIPYRRGYLLYGPPGTGKSSLSLALAGYFKMRIYIVSLNSMLATEETLSTLFSELPRRCVVLLEDIDTAGLTHTREEESKDSEDENKKSSGRNDNEKERIGRLSLSGLLNVLDGVASQEGRVLIMTTNHIDKLDRALIRPGRVDMMVKFSLADAEMTSAVFRAIFAYLEGDDELNFSQNGSPSLESPETLEERARKREAYDAEINALAEEFAAKIPALEFSPAELQGLLLRHKHNPRAAVENAQGFVEQTRKDRREKELKEAEERRKAEAEKKAKEEKKKQEASAKAEAKKDEQEKQDKEAKAKAKAESPIIEPPTTETERAEEPIAPIPILSPGDVAPTEKLQIETKDTTGHKRHDSGYATPSSSDP